MCGVVCCCWFHGFTHSATQRFFTVNNHVIFNYLDPKGPKADALRTWVRENEAILVEKRTRVSQVQSPQKERKTISIAELQEKKACTTLQEERFWVQVTIPKVEETNLYFYLGCSKCGR